MSDFSKCISVANIEVGIWKGLMAFPGEKHVATLCKV